MLGLDPLYVANEGVAVAIVAPGDADAVLAAARAVDVGAHAAIVGSVEEGAPRVGVRTGLGATRPLIMLAGDQLPRIC
jgi:hydrogenase expression/formation protein HypE